MRQHVRTTLSVEHPNRLHSKRRVGRRAKATCIDMKYLFAVTILSMSCNNIAVVDRDFVASEAEHVDVDFVQNYVDTRNHYQLVHDNDSAIKADMDGRLLRNAALCANCRACWRSIIGMWFTHCWIITGVCGGTTCECC
ncbi:hypothetical protein FOZ60_010545 [Perkinsus olseni]|uniref:Uncharacterized protein n=1 Tax=Perkinsus olseni TaxID=32597 RepID=A0A7J6PE16_PEROL|nr:hypothetical protein FOZ60_010545 [Perkinsus olseni]